MQALTADKPRGLAGRSAKLVLALAALTFTLDGTVAWGTIDPARGVQEPTLKDVLEKGLRARLPSEFRFIAQVVEMVEKGQLPRSLVESTFVWARRQHRYPMPYFERALRIRARQIGIEL